MAVSLDDTIPGSMCSDEEDARARMLGGESARPENARLATRKSAAFVVVGVAALLGLVAVVLSRREVAKEAEVSMLAGEAEVVLTCPVGTRQIGELGADILGCGLEACFERYETPSIEACRDKCEANDQCYSFGWIPVSSDEGYEGKTVCTLHDQDTPTGTRGPSVILCRIEVEDPLHEDDLRKKKWYDKRSELCKGVGRIEWLGAPVDPRASPLCWQIRLSEQKKRREPRITYNSKREKFPNSQCKRKLGAEYDIYNRREHNIFDFTAKSMGNRILNVGGYDPVGMCAHGQLGNPNCCNWTGNTRLNYDMYPHLCWEWPSDLPWDGTSLVPKTYTDQDPQIAERILPGFAQNAGCKGGTSRVPGTDQTFCDNANNFYQVGCQNVNEKTGVTDCGMHTPSTQYVYQLPPFAKGQGDGSEFEQPNNALGIYAAGDQTTYKQAKLAPAGTKFGDGQTTDGQPKEFDDYGWAFKQMHGKGYACVNARVKMLDECEERKLNLKGIATMPKRRQVGIFAKDDGVGKQWPAMVRVAGNRNHTVYDWHDIRVNGLAIKLYDAQDVTGERGENRVKIADIPRTDYALGKPPINPPYGEDIEDNIELESYGIPDARDGFRGNLEALQNVTTVDFLFVAIRGQYQYGCNENSPECLYNIFPAGGNGQCYSSMFLYGYPSPAAQDMCQYPEGEFDTHATWNPFNYTYGSSAALMLGNDGAFKMMVQPCGAPYSDDGVDYWQKITNTIQDPADPNFKANNMNETLKGSSMQLCIFAQIQENPCTEPIEDATVKWNTEIRLAGRVYIESGVTPRYNQVCDNTVFNPYRALTSHMPIGSLQRIRQAVYAYAAQFRLYHNHGQTQSPDELYASVLPLRQPNSFAEPTIPAPIEAKCPLGFEVPQQQQQQTYG